jgi:hypothetical protein
VKRTPGRSRAKLPAGLGSRHPVRIKHDANLTPEQVEQDGDALAIANPVEQSQTLGENARYNSHALS